MLKIEKTVLPSGEQMQIIIEGMRNPLNSWSKIDSRFDDNGEYVIGEADLNLMKKLAKAGSVHAKYRRMIPVWVTVTAPLYLFKEFETYKVGTVSNSCSTMHRIAEKEFTKEDFSCEHLIGRYEKDWLNINEMYSDEVLEEYWSGMDVLDQTIRVLNFYRQKFIETNNKKYWWQLIQLLPSSYNQKRTLMLNYEVLAAIYRDRKDHRLDEWVKFCEWIESLPHSELITGKGENNVG